MQAARPFASKTDGKMGYEDFVYFILSEEDKTNSISLDYWFKCIDLDCDGCLRANEMLVRALAHCLKAYMQKEHRTIRRTALYWLRWQCHSQQAFVAQSPLPCIYICLLLLLMHDHPDRLLECSPYC